MDENEQLMTSEDDEMNRLVSAVQNTSLRPAHQERRGSIPNSSGSKPPIQSGVSGPRNHLGWFHKLGFA